MILRRDYYSPRMEAILEYVKKKKITSIKDIHNGADSDHTLDNTHQSVRRLEAHGLIRVTTRRPKSSIVEYLDKLK